MSKKWVLVIVLWVGVSGILSGCTSLIANVISHPPVLEFDPNTFGQSPKSMGFETHEFCSKKLMKCISYLKVQPFSKDEIKPTSNVRYNLESMAGGIESKVTYKVTGADYNRVKGTLVLFHGYRGAKEVMITTALYFRTLGFSVIIPDLFGHGSSQETIGFGAKEAPIVKELLQQLSNRIPLSPPLLASGHSMGALTAMHLTSEMHEEIDGVLLLAPMVQFDVAANRYFSYRYPILDSLIPNSFIKNGAMQAIESANLSLPQTNIKHLISVAEQPVLIFTSEFDKVSPYSDFVGFPNKNIQVVNRPGRNHPSLMVFSKQDADIFEEWLFNKVLAPEKNQ